MLLEVLRVVEEDGREHVRHPQGVLDAQLRAEEDHRQHARQEDGDGRRVALEDRVRVLEHGGDRQTARALEASNLANCLLDVERYEEARSLLRKTLPAARRVLDESHADTLRLRWYFAQSLYKDPAATLDDLRETVNTLEDVQRIARRVFGATHPDTDGIECYLDESRAALRARE